MIAVDATLEPVPDRDALWRMILAGGVTHVGYLRLDADGVWVVRDRGSETEAATVRRFVYRGQALKWLVHQASITVEAQ